MSELTSGSLSLLKYKEAILKHDPVYAEDLNDKWFVFITKDTEESEEIPESLFQISEKIPVLYFYNFEDHCWGYRVVYNSQEIASLHISYVLLDTSIIKLAEQRYPEEDHIEFLYVDPRGDKIRIELIEEVLRSNEYNEKIAKQFTNCNLETFRFFELDNEQIKQLEDILNNSYYTQLESEHELVEEFKELLNIEEMSWIRADRMNED
ncbi:hypothetical protein G7L40_16360 [Paenibacillus polymyxa]|uniref:Uncharacterized protein n=1 Tax=Paenibacillus polymyxa TaxID=1406 RepID=A0A378Y405_PAEPO|nr:hypothetical protein [Paenibacillus polymyxa]MBE7896940.1 hypothetical protein [Paenibacillus polymyxa]MBG9767142.1 hypothetical protein [Paenibacillus polymyxa]MCC3258850.1 hypothetical protein [Paenibacillus polymyxa]QPK54106.1 hypothetical protein G7035_16400 [Paenibacillus polymyxa]QPK59194.1 hypothetical protein G7L40_16360 [Paenibacillus polymyxa]